MICSFLGENDFGYSYLKSLSQNLFGIQKVSRIAAEGLDLEGADVQKILRNATSI